MKSILVSLILAASMAGCLSHRAVYKDAASLDSASDVQLATAYAEARHWNGAESDACKRLRAEMVTRSYPKPWEWRHIDAREVTTGMSFVGAQAVLGYLHVDAASDYADGDTSVASHHYRRGQGGMLVTYKDGVVVGTTRY